MTLEISCLSIFSSCYVTKLSYINGHNLIRHRIQKPPHSTPKLLTLQNIGGSSSKYDMMFSAVGLPAGLTLKELFKGNAKPDHIKVEVY